LDFNKQKHVEEDDYVPYVPMKQRRLEKLHQYATQRRVPEPTTQPDSDSEDDAPAAGPKASISLLEQSAEVRKQLGLQGTNEPKTRSRSLDPSVH
jgi:ATP-dependent RNA helicase DDX41